jgi:putative ABC transport system ATP-binding protein
VLLDRTASADGLRPDGLRPVGLILQGYGLVGVLTAAENVEVALQAYRPVLPREHIRGRALAALEAVGIADAGNRLVDQLSGGQQQRVAIARALVIEPALLLADELTAELDHDTKLVILTVIRALADRGATVVVATHDRDVAQLCDRQTALDDGRAVQEVTGRHSRS